MRKRHKHPMPPNGFDTIRYLGKHRTNPYAVHPPATETDDHGNYLRPKALCYVNDWYVGFAVLNAYHAGTYKPGDEVKFKQYRPLDDLALGELCQRILTDFTAHAYVQAEAKKKEKNFAEIYELFFEWKYNEDNKKQLSKQSMGSTKSAFKNLSALHQRVFKDLRHKDYQDLIDTCPLKSASTENMVSLVKQMYKTLEKLGIEKYTPHDCRHTFSWLCERDKVNDNDRRRMLGHSFGADITNGIYGHRTLEELRTEIERIECDYLMSSVDEKQVKSQ